MSEPGKQFQDEDLDAPLALVSALKGLPKEKIFVPGSIDQAVLKASRNQLQRTQHPKRILFPWRIWAAATMVMLALILAVHFAVVKSRHTRQTAQFAPEDINRDGQVDILDALLLAQELRTGHSRTAGLDLNGDGVVDEKDVEVVAARAVRLEKGGS
jgi:hypothetical protein